MNDEEESDLVDHLTNMVLGKYHLTYLTSMQTEHLLRELTFKLCTINIPISKIRNKAYRNEQEHAQSEVSTQESSPRSSSQESLII